MSSVMRFDTWQDSEGNTVYDGATGGLIVPGLVAVKDVLKTDTFTASVAGGANVAVTDLSITHEVASASNKLIITAFLGAAANSFGYGAIALAVAEDGTPLAVGTPAGTRISATAGGWVAASNDVRTTSHPSITFVHTPGSGSKTYTVRVFNMLASTQTLYVNRNESDFDEPQRIRAASSLVIQEVAV